MAVTKDYFTLKMKNEAENKGDTWTFKNMKRYSPRLKETPMKPSQITNRLIAPPRRMLPVLSPDQCQNYGSPSPYKPLCHPPPIRSSELHHAAHHKWPRGMRTMPVTRPLPPVTTSTVAKTPNTTQIYCPNISHAEPPRHKEALNSHSPSTHIDRGHESMMASGSEKSNIVQRLQSTKEHVPKTSSEKSIPDMSLDPSSQKQQRECEDSDASVKRPESPCIAHHKWPWGMQTIPVTPPQPPVTASRVSKSHDRAQIRQKSTVASDLEKSNSVQRVQSMKECATKPSGENSNPVVDCEPSSKKRCRDSEDSNASVKKPCVRIELPKLFLQSPPSTSLASPSLLKLTDIPKEQSTCSDPSHKSNPTLLPSTPAISVTKQSFVGARQLQIHSTHGNLIQLGSLSKPRGDVIKTSSEKCDKKAKAEIHPENNLPHSSPPPQSQHGSIESSASTPKHTSHGVLHEPPSKVTHSLSALPAKRNKRHHRRKTIPNDYDELFTPDVILRPALKTKTEATEKKTPGFSSAVQSAKNTPTKFPIASKHLDISLPHVSLERLNMKKIPSFNSIDAKSKDCAVPPSRSNQMPDTLKHDKENKAKQPSASHGSSSPPIKRSHRQRPLREKMDSVDEDLDMSLDLVFELESSQISDSSDEEKLLSWRDIANRVSKVPATPDKTAAFSEPGALGASSIAFKPPTATRSSYRNSLDQILKELDTQKKADENETQLRTLCGDEVLGVADFDELENCDEASGTQQGFLQRYSLECTAIRELPLGEVVFHLDKFGQIFNQDSLQLRQCAVKPQTAAQKTLIWSSPAQLKLHVMIGLFQNAYCSQSPCPTQITDFLFKMMSVHSEWLLSEKMLQALCDIASSAAYHIVKNQSHAFTVWVPTLADVTLVLMNMGVAFVTLFPFENLQPAFTEGDLLMNLYIQSDCPSRKEEQNTFPEHNCNNIFKYLSYCLSICPKAYSDDELLMLLTMTAQVALDTHLIPLASVEINKLLTMIVSNIRDWDTMLPRICQTLTGLTDDHHNMCHLVQLLPENTHKKCLRQHLSLSMISKLLDGTSRYRPTGGELKLTALKPYVAAMQPTSLRRFLLKTSSRSSTEEDLKFLDQQSYYLCYSLLTLTNEASKFCFFPVHQKEDLQSLLSDLTSHVMCHIRESEKYLYRTKVHDLLARIYTRWHMTLQRIQPLHSKICDYWQPSSTRTSIHRQKEIDGSRGLHTAGENAEEAQDETMSAGTAATSRGIQPFLTSYASR